MYPSFFAPSNYGGFQKKPTGRRTRVRVIASMEENCRKKADNVSTNIELTFHQDERSAFGSESANLFSTSMLSLFNESNKSISVRIFILHLEVFYEGGRTYDDNRFGDDGGWLHAAGVEVNYGLSILRFLRFAPGIGVAYAPQRDDRDPDEYEAVAYLSLKLWTGF